MWTVTPSVEWFLHTHPHIHICTSCDTHTHWHTQADLRTVRLLQLTCFLSKLFIFIYVLFIPLGLPFSCPFSHVSFIVL